MPQWKKIIKRQKPGRPYKMLNSQGMYAKAYKYVDKALETVVECLDSKNEAIRLGASRIILDKCIPNIKAFTIIANENVPINLSLRGETKEKYR